MSEPACFRHRRKLAELPHTRGGGVQAGGGVAGEGEWSGLGLGYVEPSPSVASVRPPQNGEPGASASVPG
eukprot:scaffold96606_cov51-Phaeocystis_antarctica.AAC.1